MIIAIYSLNKIIQYQLMKKYYTAAALFFALIINAQEKQIKQTIETFFKGFHARDTVTMKSTCSNTLILQSIAQNSTGNTLSNESVQKFYGSIASIPLTMSFQEKLLSFKIQIDGAMAQVWTPYELYVNEKLSHKGVNSFTLFYDNNSWKIIHLIDTRRK
jgi:hypothetical protein